MAWKHICRMAKKGLIKVFKDEIAFSKDTTPRISWRDDAPDVVYGKPSATNFVNYGQYCYCNTYSFGV